MGQADLGEVGRELESIVGSIFGGGRSRKMMWEEHRLDSHCDEAHHIIVAHNPRSGSDLPVLPLGADLETILYPAGVTSA